MVHPSSAVYRRGLAETIATAHGRVFGRFNDEPHANARLIAAAPDLLEAAEFLLLVVRAGGINAILTQSSPEEVDGHHDGLMSCIADAEAAVAKARGRQ